MLIRADEQHVEICARPLEKDFGAVSVDRSAEEVAFSDDARCTGPECGVGVSIGAGIGGCKVGDRFSGIFHVWFKVHLSFPNILNASEVERKWVVQLSSRSAALSGKQPGSLLCLRPVYDPGGDGLPCMLNSHLILRTMRVFRVRFKCAQKFAQAIYLSLVVSNLTGN
jgi:hypothetical protein